MRTKYVGSADVIDLKTENTRGSGNEAGGYGSEFSRREVAKR